MDFRQSLQVKMGLEQRLVMTQSLQQAIRLLQLSRTELMDSIGEALSENPMLEEVPMADIGPGDTPSPITQGEGSTTDFEAPVQQAERNEIDWQSYFTDLARAPTEGAGSYRDTDEERPGLAQTLTRGSTLREHLEEQLATQEFDTDLLRITEDIIGNLDEDGYFRPSRLDVRGGNDTLKRSLLRQAQAQGIEAREVGSALSLAWLTDPELLEWQTLAEAKGFECEVFVANSLRDVAMRCHATEEDVIQALDLVKSLDPAGIASRDLRECLALQAEQRYPDDLLLHRLIDQHLPRIEARDYAGIRRDLRCTAEDLERMLHTLATLEPRPGRRFTGEMARYITPDVFVTKVGDDYLVTLNEDGLPKLRIANYYHTALAAVEEGYKAQLQAKDEEIQRYHQQNANMQEVVKLLAAKPITIDVRATAESKAMQGNDHSQNLNIQGDFNLKAHNSVVSLGDISGQVSNQIHQLPLDSPPGQPSLRELLTQLQQAIETDPELQDSDKVEALAEVQELATAAQHPEPGVMQKAAKRAMNGLKGIAASLSDVSKLAVACKDLLPLIMAALGLP